MKIKILIYLLCFVFLILLFQIFNTNKILNFQEGLLQNQNKELKLLKKDLQDARNQAAQAVLFTLKSAPTGKAVEAYREQIQKSLLQQHKEQPNFLFPSENLEGVVLLEKTHVLNEHWLITRFNNQKRAGELLVWYADSPEGFSFKPLALVYD